MASSKPTILIVHGAWSPPVCYEPFQSRLEAMGYECYCPQLPSVGPNSGGVTVNADIETVRKVAIDLFDQGKEVVVIAHSAGGVPACAATQGLDIAARAKQGKLGGFRHVIFLAAFAIPVHGWDLLKTFGGKWPEWFTAGEPYTGGHVTHLKDAAKGVLYNDTPEADAAKYFQLTQPQSQDCFETAVNFIPADMVVPKTYIICEKDQTVPAALQRQLTEQIPGFRVETIDTDHSPYVSRADDFAQLAKRLIETS